MGKLIDLFEKLLKFIGHIVSTLLLGESKNDIKYIRKEVDTAIKPDIKDLNNKFAKLDKIVGIMQNKIDLMWKEELAPSSSPMALNERGKKILSESGIKEIIDKRKTELYEKVKSKEPRNAYWIQKHALKAAYKIGKEEKLIPRLEMAAYQAGVDIDSILFVGGIYLRDLIMPDFHCKIEDIDKCPEAKEKKTTS